MPETQLLKAFFTNQTGRGFSDKTVARRRSSLSRFRISIAPLILADATPELVEEWVHRFTAPATRHAYRGDLVAFYAWANKRKLINGNPAADTDTIKTPGNLPRPIDPQLIPIILASCTDPEIRLWCGLGAYAGLRCAEISNLSREDIVLHGANPTLTVRAGKGGKDRVIPVHPDLRPLIASYKRPGPMFTADGDTVGKWGAAHIRSCGIDATMHQLRHTFGTELARASGGNVVLVAYLMGHRSMSTTMGYIGWAGGPNTEIVASMYPELDIDGLAAA